MPPLSTEPSGALPLLKPFGIDRDKDSKGRGDKSEHSESRELESFSSPIKKRKLSPPKKAPERYLEPPAPQRRNSASQRKETTTSESRLVSTLDSFAITLIFQSRKCDLTNNCPPSLINAYNTAMSIFTNQVSQTVILC